MKQNFTRIIRLALLLNLITPNITKAQNHPTQYNNTDIINTLNGNIDRIDNTITTLTSQLEEGIHAQKRSSNTTQIQIKDLKQQINELQESNKKLSKELAIQKIEIENLKNLTSMYAEDVKKLEKKDSNTPNTNTNTITTTVTKPVITVKKATPKIIEENTSPNMQIENSAPNDLLLQSTALREEINEEKKQPYTDEETFQMAYATYTSKNYTDSAIQFAANIKAFPNEKNFFKNLLYLGHSMKKLDNKIGACTAYAKIIHSKENIESKIKEEAENGFNQLNCNKR